MEKLIFAGFCQLTKNPLARLNIFHPPFFRSSHSIWYLSKNTFPHSVYFFCKVKSQLWTIGGLERRINNIYIKYENINSPNKLFWECCWFLLCDSGRLWRAGTEGGTDGCQQHSSSCPWRPHTIITSNRPTTFSSISFVTSGVIFDFILLLLHCTLSTVLLWLYSSLCAIMQCCWLPVRLPGWDTSIWSPHPNPQCLLMSASCG